MAAWPDGSASATRSATGTGLSARLTVLHDRDPSLIVTTDTRRDANLGEMDSFQIIFDTYHDRQNGFIFGTNAAG